MFYDRNLLSIRKKGKLARCWLAATLSKKMFKKTIKPRTLERIQIADLCEEILRKVCGRGSNMNHNRFSLYLSSQLLYGTAKILLYQTELLQDNLFATSWILHTEWSSEKQEFDAALALPEPEIPENLNEILNERIAAPDLHLITDDHFVLGNIVQDELNFGALTNDEMDRFLSPQAEEQLLNEIRTFLCDGPQEIIGETVQVSSIDLNNRDVETIQTRTETLSIDNQDILFKIPVKSTKGTTMSLLETPTKRRKISTEEIRCAQTPSSVDMALLAHAEEPASQLKEPIVPESVAEPAEISVQGPVVLTEVPIPQVQVIEGEELILESRRGGIKIVDKKILLSSIEMQRWITNVHAHTKSRGLHNRHFHSVKYYFRQPYSKILHGVLGKPLAKLFSRHMITRPVTNNEFTDVDIDSPIPALRHDDTVRAEATSVAHERTFDISSQIAPTTEINNNLATADTIPLHEDLLSKLPEAQIETSREEIGETLPALPEIAEFEENIGPVYHQLQPTTETELGRLLQDHWGEKTHAKFHEIIPPDTNTKLDAVRAFRCLLDFHAKKRVVLKQTKPFDTIWIEKPVEGSDESEKSTEETL